MFFFDNTTNDNQLLIKKHAKKLECTEKEYIKTIKYVYILCLYI